MFQWLLRTERTQIRRQRVADGITNRRVNFIKKNEFVSYLFFFMSIKVDLFETVQ